jgi:hypothetical protein
MRHATLSNECMKPSKLKRHLECIHPEYSSKPVDFFVNKKNYLLQKKHEKRTFYEFFQWKFGFGFIWSFKTNSRDSLLKIITSRVYGGKQENQLSSLSLSNNTVKGRIKDMAKNIGEPLIHRIQNSHFFSLQVNESTDIADNASLPIWCAL